MGGLKKYFPDIRFGGNQVTPDEMDVYQQYVVIHPTTSATWVGTCAGGTKGVAKPLVIINAMLDYPRNLLYSVVGTNDIGGTWTVNGKDQFGNTISESVAWGTVAQGTPAAASAGTAIFSEVTSGTFTGHTSGSAGSGSARLGVAVGTGGTIQHYFGLPTKIASVDDVKSITWSKEHVTTTFAGGTLSSSYIGTARHTFCGTETVGGTEIFTVLIKSSYNAENDGNKMSNRT